MAKRASAPNIISHWYHLIDNAQASSKEFYASVEQYLQKRQVPDVQTSRVDWPEGGPFSPRREYLRVQRKDYIFDVCAAPFGSGFFFSWWLGQAEGCLAAIGNIAVIGIFVRWLFKPLTYYQIDTALMFQEAVRGAVNDAIDQMTSSRGLRALSELERKPIMRAFYDR